MVNFTDVLRVHGKDSRISSKVTRSLCFTGDNYGHFRASSLMVSSQSPLLDRQIQVIYSRSTTEP